MIEYENLKKANEVFIDDYQNGLSKLLQSGWFILGKEVSSFEKKYAGFCKVSECIGVASGLDALVLALDAANFPDGSEILVPSNTYIATILAILRNNLIPILVEPCIDTYNIDPNKVIEKISKKTRGIIAVHLYGKSCDMDPIMEIAAQYKLEIFEDAAQAHGAKYKNRPIGGFGIGCHSFYPTKNLGCLGDGGAITTNDDFLAKKIRMLRNYGSTEKYKNELIGYNSRLDELQAIFLKIKLDKLHKITNHKRKLARLYLENLSDDLIKPQVHKDYYDVYHIFNVRLKNRDELREYLKSNDIQTEIHYPIPPHRQKAMKNLLQGEFPISEEIHATTLSLPISFFHSEEDIYKVIECINKYIK